MRPLYSEFLVFLLRCYLALRKSGQSETLIPIRNTDSSHILQQLDHFSLGSRRLIQRPNAGATREALELQVKPESVDFRVPVCIEPGAQALVVEGIEHVLGHCPVVFVLEVLVSDNVYGSVHGIVSRVLPIKTPVCFRLNRVKDIMRRDNVKITVLTILVGGPGHPTAWSQKPYCHNWISWAAFTRLQQPVWIINFVRVVVQ